MKIGLSISFCIADIIDDIVLESEVERIITGTECKSEEDWKRVEENYSYVYWKKNPQRGIALMYKFLALGKVDQPRVRGEEPPCIAHGHWIDASGMNQYLVMGYYQQNQMFRWRIITASSARDAIDDMYGHETEGFEVEGVIPYLFFDSRMQDVVENVVKRKRLHV